MTYTEAVALLLEPEHLQAGQFAVKPVWGTDFGSEHERYLTETVYKKPVVIYNYPKEFKSFYMRLNDDGKTVAAADVLVPNVGEIIGGSAREERLDVLEARIRESGANPEDYKWYVDLRKYGTIPHAGFGLGFERLIRILLSIKPLVNILDTDTVVALKLLVLSQIEIPMPNVANSVFRSKSEATSARNMTPDLSSRIEYSEKYVDDTHEYRHVILPKEMQRSLPDRLLTETEWRQLGVQQSRGWVHYAIHKPEPHILLFRRPLGTDPTTGRVNLEMEKQAKEKYANEFN
ncbi:hypothetical protein CCR75_005923 [Bremia lactucae]|uniref:Cyclin-dependent kinases regulatory subunit n=1 Tax=Bremia lactucae TaxID=4779 RepID=A0A976ILH7_BRELC|nr:hypothetical protein CCR75_005923 [Bremia lactucae]